MMPDKIYLNKYMLRKGMMYPAQPPVDVPEEEYIRKDALLEWAKEQMRIHENRILEAAITNTAKIGASISGIKRDMYQVFIDKLNVI